MKNTSVRFGAILALMTVLLSVIVPVTAAEKTTFTCTEEIIAVLDPGTMSFPDGNVHLRGMVLLARNTEPVPLNLGYNTIVMNANWGQDGTGPIWGTFNLETDEGGSWEGTWNGMDTGQGTYYHAVGKGYGQYAGTKVWVDKYFDDCQVTYLEHGD